MSLVDVTDLTLDEIKKIPANKSKYTTIFSKARLLSKNNIKIIYLRNDFSREEEINDSNIIILDRL